MSLSRNALTILQSCRFHVFNLAGPDSRYTRQTLMLELTGQGLPLAKCGITALWDVLVSQLQAPNDCMARQESYMQDRMESMIRENQCSMS